MIPFISGISLCLFSLIYSENLRNRIAEEISEEEHWDRGHNAVFSVTASIFSAGLSNAFIEKGYSGLELIVVVLISGILMTVISADLQYMIVPDELNLSIFALSSVFHLHRLIVYERSSYIISSLKGMLFIAAVFFLIYRIDSDGIGHGDFKLFLALSSFLTLRDTISLFVLSFVFGAVISVFLILFRFKDRKSRIPFAPFISVSAVFTLLYGSFF